VGLFPHFSLPYNLLARAYTLKGTTADAEGILQREERESAGAARFLWLASALARAGKQEQARISIGQWPRFQGKR